MARREEETQEKWITDELYEMISEEIDEEVADLFADAEQFDSALLDEYAEAMSEELVKALTPKKSSRQQAREARRERVTKRREEQADKPARKSKADQLEEEGATIVTALEQLFDAMPTGQGFIIQRVAKKKWALIPEEAAQLQSSTKAKTRGRGTSESRKIVNGLKSPEYLNHQDMVKNNYDTPEKREAWALELGIEWSKATKDGSPKTWMTQWLEISPKLREKLNVNKYIVEDGSTQDVARLVESGKYTLEQLHKMYEEKGAPLTLAELNGGE